MATQTPQRVYRGMTAAQRRSDRRARLVEAAVEVLATDGWEGTTVTAICEQAGLIPRYFYENFRDLEALLIAVFDAILGEVTEEIAAGPEDDGSVAGLLRASIAGWLAVASRDPRKGRVAFVEALGSETLMQRRLDATRAYADLLTERSKAAGRRTRRSSAALSSASLIAAGGLIETMIEWIRGDLDLSANEVVENYTRLCSALFATATGSGHGGG